MSYEDDYVKPARRRIILEFLEETQNNESNADIILHMINGVRDGFSVYYQDVIEDLGYLEQRGYVELSGSEIVVVTATMRGLRVASGAARDEGIAPKRRKA